MHYKEKNIRADGLFAVPVVPAWGSLFLFSLSLFLVFFLPVLAGYVTTVQSLNILGTFSRDKRNSHLGWIKLNSSLNKERGFQRFDC